MPVPIGRPRTAADATDHQATVLPPSNIGDDIESQRQRIEQALYAQDPSTRALIAKLRTSIPAYGEKHALGNIGDTVVNAGTYAVGNILRITSIIVSTPLASTSVVLTFGINANSPKQIPLPSGLCVLAPISSLWQPTEKAFLTIAPALTVTAMLWIMGEQLPEVDF